MITDSTRRVLRTLVQGVLSLAAAAPLLVLSSGIPAQTAGVGIFLAVAAGITRVMAVPAVDGLLPSWLRTAPPAPAVPTIPAPPASGGGA